MEYKSCKQCNGVLTWKQFCNTIQDNIPFPFPLTAATAAAFVSYMAVTKNEGLEIKPLHNDETEDRFLTSSNLSDLTSVCWKKTNGNKSTLSPMHLSTASCTFSFGLTHLVLSQVTELDCGKWHPSLRKTWKAHYISSLQRSARHWLMIN